MADDREHGQSQDWDETEAEHWVAQERRYEAMLAPFGLRMLDAVALAQGESVLDVGCGSGSTSLEVGRRTGPGGSVLGVDVSPAMIGRARQRAAEEGLVHVRFEQGDAQTHPLSDGRFDAVLSRFGLQHFTDPPAAFANLTRALQPGGRIAFVCWQGPGTR
jgi:ubiquinone/menaquinone biosynthesis C-methylase UbiE